MPEKYYRIVSLPFGPVTLLADDHALIGLSFAAETPPDARAEDTPLLLEAQAQLEAYIRGERRAFDLPLRPKGTAFETRVWELLRTIPYGETRTYGQLAESLGNPKACRAVGRANGRNPLAIFIPCHRVIGKDGTLTGFAGGLETKRFLLALEGCL